MREKLKAISIVAIIVAIFGGICGGVLWYDQNTELVERSGVVTEKYMYEESGNIVIVVPDSAIGIPVGEHMEYILVLDNGSKHEVSWDTFVNYKIGDTYTYTIRKWKS